MKVSVETLKQTACEAIDAAADELNRVSQEIWSHPEECYQEHYAHKILTEFLEQHQFSVTRHYVVDTGFRATYGAGAGTNLAVLCEYDSLPEIGHGCGHNLIAEAGVAAALGIRAAMETASQQGDTLGQLTVLGTPAEESGGGKIDFIRAGAFSGVDAAMMIHPFNVTSAVFNVSERHEVRVRYEGRASHAAAFPWEGINALDAAVLAYNNMSVLRQQCKPDWRIHGIITKGGVKPNIIPEVSELHYYLRTMSTADSTVLNTKATACFNSAAQATGCSVEITWDAKPYQCMRSDPILTELYRANGTALGETISDLKQPSGGSTDMGNVTHVVPGIHPMFKVADDAFCHTRAFTEVAGGPAAQIPTLTHAKIMAKTALDVLCDPDVVARMKAGFDGTPL